MEDNTEEVTQTSNIFFCILYWLNYINSIFLDRVRC